MSRLKLLLTDPAVVHALADGLVRTLEARGRVRAERARAKAQIATRLLDLALGGTLGTLGTIVYHLAG